MKQDNIQSSPCAIALGFFDGVHKGHGRLLHQVTKNPHQAMPTALTFDRHPATVLGSQTTPLLSTLPDRKWLLQHYYGVQTVFVAEFSAIMSMHWKDFIANYLHSQRNVVHIVAGHDFHFGKGGEGTPKKLKELCHDLGITCDIIPPVTLDDVVVSSTYIRGLIQQGEMEKAVHFLGHPHILTNEVQHGNKIGRSALGFPTVNLAIPKGTIVPKYGVYACRIWVEGMPYLAVTNIGIRPTIVENTPKQVTVEGFLLDFPDKELYGTTLRMEFYYYIRGEQKFSDLSALTHQIAKDVETTVHYFKEKNMVSIDL